METLKEIEVVRPQIAEKLAEETLRGEVDAVVAFHDSDVRAAITTLLLDCHHLRLRLAFAERGMNCGMTPGRSQTVERA
ncbi:hypothetical protein HFO41_10380 [Rhizobium leguminosarum]|uniref:hypothetical protein n=1 Tax=Rhizobium leguminosarum TaxID=384 RepID=UPI001A9152C8|nr:hypothetical protein [Rhizobium leguminosarum]MBY5552561.1 hypothetical protein [Rhizobium leguminosarum]MBY5633978.1 hypothetical protein [Rhizobium leguminosarum]MBY5689235.1 hypothetical protein [Rhizobium leguminosarum]MBY5724340.1 hypothetical protein [Rhizobium leguminosarum]MBY5743620.1 hypothetical protein [Rhizobium leguminosarum]